MKQGTIAETRDDKLQNKLRGVGSLMLREKYTCTDRLRVARALHSSTDGFDIDQARVFSAFFGKGELSDINGQLVVTTSVKEFLDDTKRGDMEVVRIAGRKDGDQFVATGIVRELGPIVTATVETQEHVAVTANGGSDPE